MERFWENMRIFFRFHKTLFDILFLLIYTIQQLSLFVLVLLWSEYAPIFSGIFALVVITTLSFEKICMESRYQWLEQKLTKQEIERQRMIMEYNTLIKKVKKKIPEEEKFK